MAQDIEKLIVSLEANLKQYERELARAQKVTVSQLRKIEGDASKSMGRVEKSFAKAGNALAGFGKGLVIGGITAAVAGIGALIKGSISSAAAIGDLSDKIGITSDKLQEIEFGAVQANMGFEELETGLLKFSKALGQAQNGTGELLKILTANGFTQAQIKAMDYGQALDVVADLIKNAKTPADALLITLAGFGKGGDAFLELLRGGSVGLKTFASEAHKADDVIKAELIKSAQIFDDAWASALNHTKKGITDFVLFAINELSKLPQSDPNAPTFGGRGGKRTGPVFQMTPPPGSTPTRAVGKPPSNFAGSGSFLAQTPTAMPPSPEDIQRLKDYAAEKERQKKAIEDVISALKFEGQQLTQSDLTQQINTELRKAGVTATSEQGKAIAALVTKNFELQASQQGAIDAGEKQLELDRQLIDSKMALAEITVDALDAIVIGGEKAEDVLAGLVKQLAQAALQASLLGQGPLAGLFGTGSSGGLFGTLFGGKRASGGPVSAGKAYLVNENTPRSEMFVPSQSGSIIPNSKGGGMNVVFSPNIDMRGADAGAVARLEVRMNKMAQDFAKNVKSAVSGERNLNFGFK